MSASAPAVNSVTLVGNLTADPVLKQLDEDRKVCQLRLAVNDAKDQPMFIDVATFGAQADACAKYLTKGRAVAVTGRLVYREWDDNGTRRSRHHIVGRVQFGGRPDNDDQPTDNGPRRPPTSEPHRRRRHTRRRRQPPPLNVRRHTAMTTPEQGYTDRATTAILDAVREEHDFGGWLAQVLATAAAELGSTAALTAGRPGSWEADLVQQLVRGTVGWDDDYLTDYAKRLTS